MNIAQIVPEMEIGGVEQGTFDLARGLLARGHKSIIISNGGRLIPKLRALGVKHYPLPVHRKSPIVMARMVKEVRRILRKENIDILHAKSRVPAWIGYYATRNCSFCHFVTSFHGFYSPHPLSKIMAKGERVIAVSRALAKYAAGKFKVPEKKLRVVYNGVEVKEYPELERKGLRIGILARATPLKGYRYFIEAFAKVRERVPDAKGFIIGPLPKDKISYKKELEGLIKKLHLRNIEFIPPEQKEEIFPTLNILVSSSIVPEAFGRTMVEAQLAGILVIATNIGASLEIIEDRKTGLLVPPNDSNALAGAIVRLLSDDDLRKKMGKAGKEKIDAKFSAQTMVSQIEKVYEEL